MPKHENPVFLFAGEYGSVEEAEVDWEAVKDLHAAHVIGTYDAALVTKDEKGKPKIVHKTEKPTQHGGWAGLGIGALIGLFWPSVLIGGLLGAGVGAFVGHLEGGISRGDLKEVGELLDEGEAVVLVIGEATIERAVEEALADAKRTLKKQVDADAEELKKAIDAA
jgi:uncharacterized membrane protein